MAVHPPTLSVIIIMHNEAAHILECLQSVAFADEWIILDSGSTDDSIEIARNFGAKVISTDWPGFGPQKNRALSYATGDWVFSIDADERVSPELAQSIQAAIRAPEANAYRIARLSNFCGRFMRHSGWYPDEILRLFQRNCARFTEDIVHEHVHFEGKTGLLAGELIHYSFSNLEQVLDKVNRYSTAGVEKILKKNKKISLGTAIFKGFWAFFRTYFLKRGFLDGSHGLMLSLSNGHGTYYRYAKAYLIQKQQRLSAPASSAPSVTLVITTYNRPDALGAVLESVALQTMRPTQVIIADDGSTTETAECIQAFSAQYAGELLHVWQEDHGFRAAAIRNRAIERAQGDYIVFIDGDCVLQPTFIARHLALAEKGFFVAGARVLLSPALTRSLLEKKTIASLYRLPFLFFQRLTGGLNRLLPLFVLSAKRPWRKKNPLRWEGAKTCNLGVWKNDLLDIHGFDEAFEGWGMEDSDLVIRLQHHGIYHKNGRFGTAVFHLWHTENDRSQLEVNQQRLKDLRQSHRAQALKGIQPPL